MFELISIDHFINTTFGNLTILKDLGMVDKKRLVKVKCICGIEKNMNWGEIKRGRSKSCGCNKNRPISFIGKKVNRWTIIEIVGVNKGKTKVKCVCECGVESVIRFETIMNGNSKSCGCLQNESVVTHGLSSHPLFDIWAGMKQRCNDKNSKAYMNYGGRGVTVSSRWETDFQAFYDWAIIRWKPGLELDKDIKSSTGSGFLYCPELCCFVTRKENLRHKRNTLKIAFNGETKCAKEWSEILGVPYHLIKSRISAGWDSSAALTTPMDKRYSKHFRK